jgi:hypothetical protein
MDEALEWAKRIPNDPERPDMKGPDLTPELRKLEEHQRTKAERLNQP